MRAMGNERPANFSLEDFYLRVSDFCGRAEFLERVHAIGKLAMSGRPNGEGRPIPLPTSTDYRLAFGTDGTGAMAVRKDLAAKWLPGEIDEPSNSNSRMRPSRWLGPRYSEWLGPGSRDWRAPPRSTPASRRRLLPENATEIDDRAYRAIRRACARAKPGDAPAAFTDLQLGSKEFIKIIKIFHEAEVAGRPISHRDMFEMLRTEKAIKEQEPGKVFGVRDAGTLLRKTKRPFNRGMMRIVMKELSPGRQRGRPPKVIK
jgi:hypothetical protein